MPYGQHFDAILEIPEHFFFLTYLRFCMLMEERGGGWRTDADYGWKTNVKEGDGWMWDGQGCIIRKSGCLLRKWDECGWRDVDEGWMWMKARSGWKLFETAGAQLLELRRSDPWVLNSSQLYWLICNLCYFNPRVTSHTEVWRVAIQWDI